MGTELEDNQEMIFICEMVVQNPVQNTIVSFQKSIDSNGYTVGTQTASVAVTATGV
jgi:hypothetical protein